MTAVDLFGNPDVAGAAIDDCPLAFAGWSASAGGTGVSVLIRLAQPVKIEITVASTGQPNITQDGTIAPGETQHRFDVPVDREDVGYVLVHISGDGPAADVTCRAKSGD